MLKAIIICPDRNLSDYLKQRLTGSERVEVTRIHFTYPDLLELKGSLSQYQPHVIFLSGELLPQAVEIVQTLGADFPEVHAVAILDEQHDPSHLLRLMRAGVRDCLAAPFVMTEIEAVLQRIETLRKSSEPEKAESGEIVAFLPSKPGDGASTVALNTALALAQQRGGRTLLADLDITSGMLRFMLKLSNQNTIGDACERADHMDESLWRRLVEKSGDLDVIHSGGCNPTATPAPGQIQHLAAFWRKHYETIFVDLSGEMSGPALEALKESQQIVVVCTAEASSLHQAKEKLEFLRSQGWAERVKLIMNRDAKQAVISAREIEEFLEVPIHAAIANDYIRVQEAQQKGRGVKQNSVLGRQFQMLASSISGSKPRPSDPSTSPWLKMGQALLSPVIRRSQVSH